jgi:hypothetical protein
VTEAKALKAATSRARAAKHERKVLALRTRTTLEDMARHTLALRIARSSRQAAAASSLLKALAAQARLGAAEQITIAAEERASEVLDAQSRVAWLNHTARLMNEVVLEETARQVAQRQAAARSQREALERAVREMRADESALLEKMKAEQAHAEAAFLAQHVETMDVRPGVGGSRAAVLGGIDGARLVEERLADGVDTDTDPQRVHTLERIHRALGREEAARQVAMRATGARLREAALDTGAALADAEAMSMLAHEQVEATSNSLRGLSVIGAMSDLLGGAERLDAAAAGGSAGGSARASAVGTRRGSASGGGGAGSALGGSSRRASGVPPPPVPVR